MEDCRKRILELQPVGSYLSYHSVCHGAFLVVRNSVFDETKNFIQPRALREPIARSQRRRVKDKDESSRRMSDQNQFDGKKYAENLRDQIHQEVQQNLGDIYPRPRRNGGI